MTSIESLLQETSRTFALSIPFLETPLRERVGVAYLLFRIADTIEDETGVDAGSRRAMLFQLAEAVSDGHALRILLDDATRTFDGIVKMPGYARLLEHAPLVLGTFESLDQHSRETIASHLARTCRGMCDHLDSPEAPSGVASLRSYCYAVAGIVGELLTQLFTAGSDTMSAAKDELIRLAPAFGEGLQLVNILRDEHEDALANRRYLPCDVSRNEIERMARADLTTAAEYVRVLESAGASPGVIAFNAINLRLAVDTLSLVTERGAGAKLTRAEVEAMIDDIRSRMIAGRPQTPALDAAIRAATPVVVQGQRIQSGSSSCC